MRLRYLAVLAVPALLAAADQPLPRAGTWDVTVHPNAIRLPPALDKEQGAIFRAAMTQPFADRICVKPAELGGGAPLFAFKGEKSCRATEVTLKDGHVTGTAECMESNQPLTAKITGTYTRDSLNYSIIRVKGGLDLPGTEMARIDSVRSGKC